MRREFNFTIGADPEFNLIMQGRRIIANLSMKELLKKDPELKSSDMGYDYKSYGNIGWDGCSSTGEIRPKPAKKPEDVVENMEKMLKKFCEKAPLFDISTLSYFASVGGHIHFSVPKEYQTNNKLANIHKKLASFYLPLMLSESKVNLQLRLKNGYGKLTDYRTARYDGNGINEDPGTDFNGYEFRSPSAEWITTKKLALATLAYLGVVYNEIINHPKKMKDLANLFYHTEKQAEALQMLAISDFKVFTKMLFKNIKKAVRTFEFYPEYKEEVNYIFNPAKILEDKRKVSYNVVQGWNISPVIKQPNKKDLVNRKQISKLATKINLDLISELINIGYNNDLNVDLFAKNLAERIALYKWRLRNTYFLFGLRKGIQDFIAFDNRENIYRGQEMIMTTSDKDAALQLYRRMKDKYEYSASNSRYPQNIMTLINDMDPERVGKIYLIGIPYLLRIDHNINPFLCFIHDLEKKDPTPLNLQSSFKNLPDDYAKSFEEKGALYQILNRNSEHPGIVFDTNSENALSRAREIVAQMKTSDENEEEPE